MVREAHGPRLSRKGFRHVKRNLFVNIITYTSSLLMYPTSIALCYFLLPTYIEKLDSEIGIFAAATFLGLAIPTFLFVFVYQMQLRISHNGQYFPIRKLVAVMLGGASIIFAQKMLTAPSTTNVLLCLQLTFMAIKIGTHQNLKDYLGISGGLSEYGYKEL